MAHAVFLRGANVGGTRVFRPTRVAAALGAFDVMNIGAAGTFVARKGTAADLRRAFERELPFATSIMVSPGREVLDLVRSVPLRDAPPPAGARRWVAVMERRPRARANLPHFIPTGKEWSVRVERVVGRFALGTYRRRPGGFVFAANVVEDALGVPATARWWETLVKVADALG